MKQFKYLSDEISTKASALHCNRVIEFENKFEFLD